METCAIFIYQICWFCSPTLSIHFLLNPSHLLFPHNPSPRMPIQNRPLFWTEHRDWIDCSNWFTKLNWKHMLSPSLSGIYDDTSGMSWWPSSRPLEEWDECCWAIVYQNIRGDYINILCFHWEQGSFFSAGIWNVDSEVFESCQKKSSLRGRPRR